MKASDKKKMIEHVRKNQGILKQELVAYFAYLGEYHVNAFIHESKELKKKKSKEGIRLYTKKNGCLGCLVPIIFLLLISACVGVFNDDEGEKSEPVKQTKVQKEEEKEEEKEEKKKEEPESIEPIQEQETEPTPVEKDTDTDKKEAFNPEPEISEDEELANAEGCISPTIKGNIANNGEKIYHVPGGAFYDRTDAEEMFCTEAEAVSYGYRESQR